MKPTDDELEAMAVRLDQSDANEYSYDNDKDEAAAMLRACKGRVRVKALEWKWSNENWSHVLRADTPIGTYTIHDDEDSAGGRMLAYLHLTDDGDCTKYAIEIAAAYLEPEEMQSLCADDFRQRIIAAIEKDPGQ